MAKIYQCDVCGKKSKKGRMLWINMDSKIRDLCDGCVEKTEIFLNELKAKSSN